MNMFSHLRNIFYSTAMFGLSAISSLMPRFFNRLYQYNSMSGLILQQEPSTQASVSASISETRGAVVEVEPVVTADVGIVETHETTEAVSVQDNHSTTQDDAAYTDPNDFSFPIFTKALNIFLKVLGFLAKGLSEMFNLNQSDDSNLDSSNNPSVVPSTTSSNVSAVRLPPKTPIMKAHGEKIPEHYRQFNNTSVPHLKFRRTN